MLAYDGRRFVYGAAGTSRLRARTRRVRRPGQHRDGYTVDPTDRLCKLVRAHGNAAEYAPMLAVLMLYLGAHNPSTWLMWTFAIATICRYLHAIGMILSKSLALPDPLRFAGALGTYVTGLILAFAVVT